MSRGERRFVLLLALVSAARVFLFAAAFPLFNNVDEEPHFDLLTKYAQGKLPGEGLEPYSPVASRLIGLYRSREFLIAPEDDPPASPRVPRWKLPEPDRSQQVERIAAHWRGLRNHETQSPPLYYGVAGAWYDLGGWLGLRGGERVYWVRFLNVPLIALLVVLAHRFCARHLPGHDLVRLGVPWLIAFLPQDVEYSINSDVVSAPIAILLLDMVLTWIAKPQRSLPLAVGVGLLSAAALLTKAPNAVIVALALAVVLVARRGALETALVVAAAAVPVALWTFRTAHLSGDPTGAAGKIQALGWTPKPLSSWLPHAIFTREGASYFFSELIRSSWRGELYWHGKRLVSAFADAFYLGSTAILSVAGGIALLLRGRRAAAVLCVAAPIASVLFLIALSMAFDFGACYYPSREHPFFTSGRLLSASLVPFLVAYVAGIEILLPQRFRRIGGWMVLSAVAAIAIGSEVAISLGVFRSPFNWFHLAG
jgi:hypothetical protein